MSIEAQVEQALNNMYSNRTDVDKKQYEKFLMDYQSSPQTWRHSLGLLSSKSHNAQFFGAQSLYTNLHRDSKIMDPVALNMIGQGLINYLHTDGKNAPAFVTIKICLALSVFTIKSLNTLPNAIQLFCSSTQDLINQSDPQLREYYIELITQYLAFIPEEASKVNSSTEGNFVKMKVAEFSPFTFSLVLPLFNDPSGKVQISALNCVASCTLFPLLDLVLQKLPQVDLLETTSDVLITLLGDNRLSGLEKNVPTKMFPVITSEFFQEKLTEAINEEDEYFLLAFAKLFCKFGELYVDFLLQNGQSVAVFYDMMLKLTSYNGSYPSNPDIAVSELTFFFWFSFEDALDSSSDPRSKHNQTKYTLTEGEGHQILARLLEVLFNRIKYPSDEEVAGWSGDKALNLIMNVFQTELDQLQRNSQLGVQSLEAAILCMKSFSESISSEEAVYTPILFSQENVAIIQNLINTKRNGYAQLEKSFSLCMADSVHPMIAANSLVEICAVCQVHLAKYPDDIMNLCMTALPTVQPPIQGRLIQALSYVIQALPPNEATPRLSFILNGIREGLTDAVYAALMINLNFLKSFCRGTGGHPIDLEDSVPKKPLSETDKALGSRFHSLLSVILQFWLNDNVEVCIILRDCHRSGISFIEAQFGNFMQLLADTFSKTQQACLLTTAATLIPTADQKITQEDIEVFSRSCTSICVSFATNCTTITYMENNPDVVAEFYQYLAWLLKRQAGIVLQLQNSIIEIIFGQTLIQGLMLQENLALQSILKFLRDFVNLNFETSPSEQFVKNVWGVICDPSDLKGIGGGHSSSVIPKLGETLLQLITLFPTETQNSLSNCLQQDGFPTALVTIEEKEVFLKTLIGIRKVKPFKECVRMFSLKCRGLSNNLPTM
ncbi:hypothetical protein HDV02_005655 [Globomyces sp. JEL0801]|nr:hypothetical protein HDV02_005655 [Globomyces sp. JEL0801]